LNALGSLLLSSIKLFRALRCNDCAMVTATDGLNENRLGGFAAPTAPKPSGVGIELHS
jgi:hypothetical protein